MTKVKINRNKYLSIKFEDVTVGQVFECEDEYPGRSYSSSKLGIPMLVAYLCHQPDKHPIQCVYHSSRTNECVCIRECIGGSIETWCGLLIICHWL